MIGRIALELQQKLLMRGEKLWMPALNCGKN